MYSQDDKFNAAQCVVMVYVQYHTGMVRYGMHMYIPYGMHTGTALPEIAPQSAIAPTIFP